MENKNYHKRNPISTNKWFGILLLLTIPLVNIYFIIYWAFIQKVSFTRRNFSRALILWGIITSLIIVLTVIILQPNFECVINTLKEMKKCT